MLGLVAAAFAAEVVTEGNVVKVDGQPIAEASGPVRSALVAGDRLYVLTSAGTLETWTISPPARVASTPVAGGVGVFSAGGRVWVEVQETRAVPLDQAPTGIVAASPTTSETSTPTAPSERKLAKVTRADRGVAVIDQGRADGLAVGDHLRFLGTEQVVVPSESGTGDEVREVEQVVGTGRVRVIEDRRAVVDVSRGGRVETGDRVERKPGAVRYPVAPERLDGIREAGAIIRPLLALDTVGVAMVGEAWLTWTFDKPWYLQARLAPVGVGVSKDGNPLTVAALGTGGYDSRYFSVGLGAGWSRLNSDPGSFDRGYYNAEDAGGGIDLPEFEDVDSAFAFVQEARLGARDGVRLGVRNTLLLVPVYTYEYVYDEMTYEVTDVKVTEEGDEFVFGGIAMDLAIPTGERTDLFVDWGTGSAGATWVEGGVNAWLRGNGGPGSVGLRVGAGYASVQGNPDDEQVELYGPMVSVGGRYRF